MEHCGTPQATPPAKLRSVTSTRCCAALRRSRYLPRRCWGLRHSGWPGFEGRGRAGWPVRGHQLCAAGGRLHFHARLHAAHADAGLSALNLSQCPDQPARWGTAPGLVPPEGCGSTSARLSSWATRERIGHGVDVMYEDDAPALLKELAKKHVMVEINLSSNEGILEFWARSTPSKTIGQRMCRWRSRPTMRV